MAQKHKMSKTMRIDLIPDVPSEPVSEKTTRVVIAPGGRAQRDRSRDPRNDTLFQELFQSVYDAAIVADLDGNIVDSNDRASEFFLYTREQFASISIFDVISGADDMLIKTLCENLEEERYTLIQAYCSRKDGTFFPSEIAVNKLILGQIHLCFFVRDITLRKQAEEMLMTEHNAIKNAGNAIAVADLGGCLEYANPAFASMWGYSDGDELIGVDMRALLSDAAAAKRVTDGVLGTKKAWAGEVRARRKDGGEFDAQVSAACNRNADGEAIGIVFSFTDISDRKRAAEAERVAERHRVMLESLGAACHHLSQPAMVLLANLGFIDKKLDHENEDLCQLMSTSKRAAQELSQILHRLNAVNEYKTTRYLDQNDRADSKESRILEI